MSLSILCKMQSGKPLFYFFLIFLGNSFALRSGKQTKAQFNSTCTKETDWNYYHVDKALKEWILSIAVVNKNASTLYKVLIAKPLVPTC